MKTTLYIPCFNAAATLAPVLEAITAQTHRPDEILVIDDGSTDATADIAAGWAPKGVTVIGQPKNLGLGAARNRALRESSGDVLIGVDSDVVIESTYVENIMAVSRNTRNWAPCVADCWSATGAQWRTGGVPST